jgi:CHAT domain-containing protein
MRLFDHLFVPIREHQEELYEFLIRPVASQLRHASRITIIADGDLEGIPFAALYDNARQRFLVQDHTLRFARSLREAFEPMSRAEVPRQSVVLVSDPSFAGFTRLAGARAEVDTIAAEYISATLLEGKSADRGSFTAVLLRTDLLHYAGHAVHDPERPERSFLALAAPHGRSGSDRLTAAELEALDLRHLRLVVLAACETSRSKKGWSVGLPGLTDAFLNAGAAGVVGSLWRVNDDHTRSLMIRFHRAYHRSRDGPAALRSAQLQLLSSKDPTFRSPAAWAGFQYTGR